MSDLFLNLLCLALFLLVMNLADFVKFKYIFRKSDYEDKMAFKRLYSTCKRKWNDSKNISLRKEYKTFEQYFDCEYNNKFGWLNVYDEKYYNSKE